MKQNVEKSTGSKSAVESRKRIAGGVLAEGEVTGHAHRIEVDVFEGVDGTREFEGAGTVRHEEHGPIAVPDGKWASGQVLEMDHLAGLVSAVRD